VVAEGVVVATAVKMVMLLKVGSGWQETSCYHRVIERHGGSADYLLSCRPRDWLEEFAGGVCWTWYARAWLLQLSLSSEVVARAVEQVQVKYAGWSSLLRMCTVDNRGLEKNLRCVRFEGPEAF